MKKLLLIPIIVFALACNSSSKPTAEEDAKAKKESDSIANAANDFLSDTSTTTAKDTTPAKEEAKKSK